MQQMAGVDQSNMGDNTAQFRYGGGFITIALGIVLVLMALGAYEPMTSGRVEWHLFLRTLPVIPHEIMVGIWWILIGGAITVIVLSLMPAVKVILDSDKITAQSIYTRKFETIYYADIVDVSYNKNYINIIDRHNKKIYLAKLFLSSGAFQTIASKLRSSTRNA